MSIESQSYTYKFALRWLTPDGEPPAVAAEQLCAFGRHYNNRIEIARKAREDYRAARTDLVPEWSAAEETLAAAQRDLDAVYLEVQAVKAATRSRAIPSELRGRLEAARTARTTAKRALTNAKAVAKENPGLTAAAARISQERNAREKEIRSATPLYWGSYLRAEDAAGVAEKKARNLPEFRRWYQGLPVPRPGEMTPPRVPEGTIAVQIQSTRSLRVADLFGGDSRIQLDPAPGKYTRGKIRVGSDGRAPIWAEFSAHIYRPLAAGRVTWVWIKRERIGSKYRHWLYLGVERDGKPQAPPTGMVTGVDINMRGVEGGIRVAVTYDGERYRHWILPERIAAKAYHAHEIQSTRDVNFNEAKLRLAKFLMDSTDVPAWLREMAQWLPNWRDHGKLARVVLEWHGKRFDGDAAILADLEGWRKHDRHLLEYFTHESEGARNRRTAIYQAWAKEWVEAGAVVVPAYDWSEMAALPWPGDDNEIPAAVRKRRHNAVAPSDLVTAIKNAARTRGVPVLKAKPEVSCIQCGGKVTEDKENGFVRCATPSCARRELRDEAQARSLWSSGERSGGDAGSGGARDGEDDVTAGGSGGDHAGDAASPVT